MGIQGLIPFLGKATRTVNIGDFAGCCVAIDAYCWLHKGAYSCVEKLARGESCDAYVNYCMKFVNMLLSHNIKPILVFDGRHLPAKAATEKKRHENRENSRKRAAELLRAGKTDEARNFLRRCIDVTHDMALTLIRECRRRNVDCIVAPYEADAQLAYLNVKNIAQIVITEDSDLVLFGCSKIMFKMDMFGNGLLVEQERLHLAMGIRPEDYSFDKFRYMCILSGCDYLPSLPGIGLSKACKFITRTADSDIHRALSRMPGHLNMRSLVVTEEYRNEFMLADMTFRYQVVFDPLTRRLTRLNEPPDCEEVTDYAGKMLPENQAYQLALGNLNPFTLEKVDTYNPDIVQQPQNVKTNSWKQVALAPHVSIWSHNYRIPGVKPRPDPHQVERPFTKGRVVLKTVKLPVGPKENVDELDGISDAELTSMYVSPEPPAKRKRIDNCDVDEAEGLPDGLSNAQLTSVYSSPESPAKRQRIESCDSGDIEVNRENGFFTSPTKITSEPAVSPAKIKTDSVPSPTKNKVDSVASPIKCISVEQIMKSPVVAGGKSRRNPFFKEHPSNSPNKNSLESSPSMLGLRDGVVEKKFSALNKFSKLQRTEIDEQVVVHSRFFNKQSKTTHINKDAEEETNTDETLKDITVKSNIIADSSLQDVEKHLTNVQVEQFSPTKVPISDLSNNRTPLESTGNEVCVKSPRKQHCNSMLSSVRNLFKYNVSCNTPTWSQKFAFQKSKSITSCSENLEPTKDFKNPFKKIDYNISEHNCEVGMESGTLKNSLKDCKKPYKTMANRNVSDVSEHVLSLLEEEEEDDPSPPDSGIEITTFKKKSNFLDSCASADEGFHSPNSSRSSQSLTPGSRSKCKTEPCRRLGLSKYSGKKQSLLSMFGFQAKSKLEHT